MIRTTLIALTLAAVSMTACGDDSSRSKEAPTTDPGMRVQAMTSAAVSAKPTGTVVKVVSSQFGRVLADRKGEAFYLFDKEQGARSECYGACAAAWPPVLTKGEPRAGAGAKAGKLGTTRRRDGTLQVIYAGRPLYYYVDDAPGLILCHDVFEFGGTWLVVQPSGRAVV